MDKNYLFYNCLLKGQQLCVGETGFLAATEVVQAICDADFRNLNLNLYNPKTKVHYYHEFVKEPKDGLYLIRVVNPKNRSCLDVLIDTREYPNFIWVEKNPLHPKESIEVAMAIKYSLNQAAKDYGWSATVRKSRSSELRYIEYFLTALDYLGIIKYPLEPTQKQPSQYQISGVSQLFMDNHGLISNT